MNPAVKKNWLSEAEKALATMPRLDSKPPSIMVTRQPNCLMRMLHRGPVGKMSSSGSGGLESGQAGLGRLLIGTSQGI